ncbi:hypothetical protein ACFHWW_26100 [Ensifer sp. P24N7]|uniref:hypothetical protein n=1 Tax=Sinorhizobium sp. P24N7 TaxID=3348358 RepID=UPI0035F3DD0C
MTTAQAGDIDPIAIETLASQTMTDQKMPGGCDQCGDQDMAMMPCSAVVGCTLGVIPGTVGFFAQSETVPYAPYAENISGIRGAPDPFPPRSDILA